VTKRRVGVTPIARRHRRYRDVSQVLCCRPL